MAMNGLGPRLPLTLDSDGGHILLKTLKDLARQNLKMIVLTDPGERMMDPTFGVGVRRLLFENQNSDTSVITSRIKSQTKKFLSWVSIDKVKISTSEHILSISILYHIPSLGPSRLLLSIPLN